MQSARNKFNYGEAIGSFHYILKIIQKVTICPWSPWYVGNSMTNLDVEFGKDRIIDTPVSEAACTGLAVGALYTVQTCCGTLELILCFTQWTLL